MLDKKKYYDSIVKVILTLSLISAITPSIFSYYYDIPFFLISFFLFFEFIFNFDKKRIENLNFLIFVFSFFFLTLKLIFIFYDYATLKDIIRGVSDLRFFIYYLFFIFIIGKGIQINRYLISSVIILTFINFIVVCIGIYFPELYSNIISFFFKSYHIPSIGESLSLVAYKHNNRITGLFLSPVASGMFFITLGYLSFLYFKYLKKPFLIMIFFQFICLFFMFQSRTSVIWIYPIIFLIHYFFELSLIFKILMILVFVFILSILIGNDFSSFYDFIYSDLLGGRYSEGGNIHLAWSSIELNFFEKFFGFSPEFKGFYGKGFGDSGYIYRLTYGGIFYVLFYFSYIFIIFLKNFNNLKNIWLPLFITALLVDFGSSYFSITHVGWLMTLSILITLNTIKERFKNSRLA